MKAGVGLITRRQRISHVASIYLRAVIYGIGITGYERDYYCLLPPFLAHLCIGGVDELVISRVRLLAFRWVLGAGCEGR